METLRITARVPQISCGEPIWFHHHGWKIQVEKFYRKSKKLFLSGSAAKLRITKVANQEDYWQLKWEVRHCIEEKVMGCVMFSSNELRAAFGLTNDSDVSGEWLINQYGGESAAHFKYIRWGEYLNIPCPGTGRGGDPNISVLADEGIRRAIRQLLK